MRVRIPPDARKKRTSKVMLKLITDIVSAIQFTAILLYFLEDKAWYYSGTIALCSWFYVGADAWTHNPLSMGVNGAVAMVWSWWAYLDWKNRKTRKRRRVLSRAGYKGKVALLKLVKSMPKPALPRIRVPVPVPQ